MVVDMGEYKHKVFKIIDVLLTKKNNQWLQDSIFIIMLRNRVRKKLKPANDLILFFSFFFLSENIGGDWEKSQEKSFQSLTVEWAEVKEKRRWK